MSVEIGIHFEVRPDREVIERLVGPTMSALLGDQMVAAWMDGSPDLWTVNWGGAASAQIVFIPPGLHEFADRWFASVSPGERGLDLSLLLAEVVAILIAVVCDGQIVDELELLGGKPGTGGQLLIRAFNNRNKSAKEIVAALRIPN